MPADHAGRESVGRGGENALGPGGSTERRRQVWAGGGLCAWSLARCCPGQVSSLGPHDGALRAGRRQERLRGSARAPCSLKTDAAWPVGRQHPEGPSGQGLVRRHFRSLSLLFPFPFLVPPAPVLWWSPELVPPGRWTDLGGRHGEAVGRERTHDTNRPNDPGHYGDEGRETTHFVLTRPESSSLGAGEGRGRVEAPRETPPPGSLWAPQHQKQRQGRGFPNRGSSRHPRRRRPAGGAAGLFQEPKTCIMDIIILLLMTWHRQTNKSVKFLLVCLFRVGIPSTRW